MYSMTKQIQNVLEGNKILCEIILIQNDNIWIEWFNSLTAYASG